RVEQPEQEVDVAADETVTVVLNWTDVRGGTKLDLGLRAGSPVVTADVATQAFGERVDDGWWSDGRRYDDQRTISSIFVDALGPGQAGSVERGLQHVVEPLVHIQLDVVVSFGRPGDIDSEHATNLYVHARCLLRGFEHASHFRPVLVRRGV